MLSYFVESMNKCALMMTFRFSSVDKGNLSEAVNENNTECIQDGKYLTGTKVEYACNEYYSLKGSRHRTCFWKGQWSGSNATCERGQLPLLLSL